VCLLNAKRQSAGLTLVCATHVFLVEPSVNPATELQAMGRVHRLGQTKETWVHRYLIRDTVEVEVYKLNQKRAIRIQSDSSELVKLEKGTEGEAVQDDDLERLLLVEMQRSGCKPPTEQDLMRIQVDVAATSRAMAQASKQSVPPSTSSRKRKGIPRRRDDPGDLE
jgi:hypothetical protein